MSEESLLESHKSDEITTTQNIRNINYGMICLVMIACGYSVLFVTMAININNMTNNLELIIQFMTKIQQNQMNATTVESIHTNLDIIKDCVFHKYCKRVPD